MTRETPIASHGAPLSSGRCAVADGGDCTDSEAVTVVESYDDCDSCKCYTLHLCGSGDPGTTLTTYSDLSAFGVGAFVAGKYHDVALCIFDAREGNHLAIYAFEGKILGLVANFVTTASAFEAKRHGYSGHQ